MLRTPFRVDVVRDRGALARLVDDGRIENVYRLQVMNATEMPQRFRIEVERPARARMVAGRGEVEVGTDRVALGAGGACRCRRRRRGALGPGAHPMRFQITRLPDAAGGEVTVARSRPSSCRAEHAEGLTPMQHHDSRSPGGSVPMVWLVLGGPLSVVVAAWPRR